MEQYPNIILKHEKCLVCMHFYSPHDFWCLVAQLVADSLLLAGTFHRHVIKKNNMEVLCIIGIIKNNMEIRCIIGIIL